MTKTIDIKSKEQVEKISELASQAPYGVWLSTGAVMLDARSLLGLFALVGKKARVVVGVFVFFSRVSKPHNQPFHGVFGKEHGFSLSVRPIKNAP